MKNTQPFRKKTYKLDTAQDTPVWLNQPAILKFFPWHADWLCVKNSGDPSANHKVCKTLTMKYFRQAKKYGEWFNDFCCNNIAIYHVSQLKRENRQSKSIVRSLWRLSFSPSSPSCLWREPSSCLSFSCQFLYFYCILCLYKNLYSPVCSQLCFI